MTAALLLALAAQAGVDPCTLPEPSGRPDPAASEAYRAVGDSERASGARDTAVLAYREALRRDPSNPRALAAFRALCLPAAASDPFQEGLRLMEEGEWSQAAARFAESRAAGPDPSAALLEGICRQELGEDEAAGRLLREAERDPSHRASARFFLGLAALRAGEGARAASLFESAATNPGLQLAASDLARLASQEGRLVLSLLGEAGYDSNVDLTPERDSNPSRSGDGIGALTALVLARPFGPSGAFARGDFTYRDQARFNLYDLAGGGGAVGWDTGGWGDFLHLEYGYDYRWLGGAPYLSAHRLLGGGGLAWGRFSLAATYLARFESFLPVASEPYSGLRQQVDAAAAWQLGIASSFSLAVRLGRDDARQSAYSWNEIGPRAELRLRLARDARLVVSAMAIWRDYQARDPSLQVIRSDVYLDGMAIGEMDLGLRWTLRLSVFARKAFSNVPDFAYTKIAPVLGLAYTFGLL